MSPAEFERQCQLKPASVRLGQLTLPYRVFEKSDQDIHTSPQPATELPAHPNLPRSTRNVRRAYPHPATTRRFSPTRPGAGWLADCFGIWATPSCRAAAASGWAALIRLLELELNERLIRTSVFRLAKEEWLCNELAGRRTDYL